MRALNLHACQGPFSLRGCNLVTFTPMVVQFYWQNTQQPPPARNNTNGNKVKCSWSVLALGKLKILQ
jgi:hypothetical protein